MGGYTHTSQPATRRVFNKRALELQSRAFKDSFPVVAASTAAASPDHRQGRRREQQRTTALILILHPAAAFEDGEAPDTESVFGGGVLAVGPKDRGLGGLFGPQQRERGSTAAAEDHHQKRGTVNLNLVWRHSSAQPLSS